MVNTDRDLNQFGGRIRKQMGDRERDERERQMHRPVQQYGGGSGQKCLPKAGSAIRPAGGVARGA